VQSILEDCLSRVPRAHIVMCVDLESGALIAEAQAPTDHPLPDSGQLAVSARRLFGGLSSRSSSVEPIPADTSEALVAATDHAFIFLRSKRRAVAVAYVVARESDLGMALASSRLTLPDIEIAVI